MNEDYYKDLEDNTEKAMAPHSSTLAWKIPWTEEPGRLQSMGSLSQTWQWLHFHFSLSCIGEGNGNPLQCSCMVNPRVGEPGGLPSMGSHSVGHDWSDSAAAASRGQQSYNMEEVQVTTWRLKRIVQESQSIRHMYWIVVWVRNKFMLL